jgi:iron complex outermembrane recepter protein
LTKYFDQYLYKFYMNPVGLVFFNTPTADNQTGIITMKSASLEHTPRHFTPVRSISGVLLFTSIIFLHSVALAQTAVVTGTVVEAPAQGSTAKTPLPGASVITTDAIAGTAADHNGRFFLPVNTRIHTTLRISYIGYTTRAVQLAGFTVQADTLDLGIITLEKGPLLFDDVIITTSPAGRSARYQPAMAYNSEQLQRLSATSFGEMLDGQPGVAMRSFGSAPARPVIRGLDGDRVLVVENGQRMGDLAETAADHAISLDPLSADRVEVVRGPASLLYGSSALGGVINLFNKDIPDSWATGSTGSASLQGASVNNELAGFGRFIYGNEATAYTARIGYRTSGDIRTPDERLAGTFNENLNGAAGFSFRHGPHSYTGISITGLGSSYGLPDALDQPGERIEIRLQRYTLRTAGHYHTTGFFNRVDFRSAANWYSHSEVEVELLPGGSFAEETDLGFKGRSLNSTLLLHHGEPGKWITGTLGLNAGVRYLGVSGDEALTPDMRSVNLAGLFYEEIDLSGRLSVQLGFRTEYQLTEALANNRFEAPENGRRSDWVSSGSAGFNWKPSRFVETGFQVARAYRMPRIEERYSDSAHPGAGAYEIGDPALKNEIGLGSDLFIRYRTGNFEAEVALFHNTIRNFVVYAPTGEIHEPSALPVFIYEAANARLFGGELSMTGRFGDFLVRTGLDYVQGDRTGRNSEPLPFIPPLRSSLYTGYDNGKWFAGAEARVISRQNRVASEEEPTPGYILLNLEGGIRMTQTPHHTITARLGNALNTSYRDHLTRIEDRNKPMPGRGLTVTYRYLF